MPHYSSEQEPHAECCSGGFGSLRYWFIEGKVLYFHSGFRIAFVESKINCSFDYMHINEQLILFFHKMKRIHRQLYQSIQYMDVVEYLNPNPSHNPFYTREQQLSENYFKLLWSLEFFTDYGTVNSDELHSGLSMCYISWNCGSAVNPFQALAAD